MAELSEDKIKRQLRQMDPYKFEELVAEIWELEGYNTIVRKGSGDRGIDIEATKQLPFSQRVLIQTKRYSENNKLGSSEVRKYATLYQQVTDADTVVIVTTGDVTSEAQNLAQDLNVKIVDGDSFAEMVATKRRSLSTDLSTKERTTKQEKRGTSDNSTNDTNYNSNFPELQNNYTVESPFDELRIHKKLMNRGVISEKEYKNRKEHLEDQTKPGEFFI